MHFGTVEGREYTEGLIVSLRKSADLNDQNANEVMRGEAQVWGFKRDQNGNRREVIIDVPTRAQQESYADRLRANANHFRAAATEFEVLVSKWTPREPVEVTVEKAKGPLVHWAGGYWAKRFNDNSKACAASAMSAQFSFGVKDITTVTCKKCLAVYERETAK
jgi:hypothetical protein